MKNNKIKYATLYSINVLIKVIKWNNHQNKYKQISSIKNNYKFHNSYLIFFILLYICFILLINYVITQYYLRSIKIQIKNTVILRKFNNIAL